MKRSTLRAAALLAGLVLFAAGGQIGVAGQRTRVEERARKSGTSPFNFFIKDPKVTIRTVGGRISAQISFATREASHGWAEISTKRFNDFPEVIPAGQQLSPAFPANAVTMSVNDGLGAKGTEHTMRMPDLTPKTIYYYVLTAADASGRTYRYTHQFSTAPQFDGTEQVAEAGNRRNGGVLDALREGGRAPSRSQAELSALADRGTVLAGEDPLATELLKQQVEPGRRRGFDIGLAAAEGHTLPGPGKDAIRGSLARDERPGFDTAVSFSLERNRNADLARRGAVISKADPAVAAARTADASVLYWLGFDIATGFFGDPALGALGHTATGPGSLKIRNALSASGQKGFDAAVAFHLARNYKR